MTIDEREEIQSDAKSRNVSRLSSKSKSQTLTIVDVRIDNTQSRTSMNNVPKSVQVLKSGAA